MPEDIEPGLRPGQTEATYRLEAGTAQELGRLVDAFIGAVDLDMYDVSGGYSVDYSIQAIRAMQAGVVRKSIGPFLTYLTIYRRDRN